MIILARLLPPSWLCEVGGWEVINTILIIEPRFAGAMNRRTVFWPWPYATWWQNCPHEWAYEETREPPSNCAGSALSSRTRIKTLAVETVEANARFFGGDVSAVPRHALTVGVGTVLDAEEVLVIINGAHKAYALAKCIEEGVNHMFTVSAIQMHPKAIVVCDEDATLELRVRTAKYFKSLPHREEMLGLIGPDPRKPGYEAANGLGNATKRQRT